MGTRYVQHSDLCGCERCAMEAGRDLPGPVFDEVEDPNVLDCGCDVQRGCDCDAYDDPDDWGFGEEDCGRWNNGRLTHSCTLAGTEDCDFECPLRGSL